MATQVTGKQFGSDGKVLRNAHLTFARGYNPTNDSFTGDIYLHIAIGARNISISIPQEEWEKAIKVGQPSSPGSQSTWQHKEPLKPHCRTHLEFRSDCSECERENV